MKWKLKFLQLYLFAISCENGFIVLFLSISSRLYESNDAKRGLLANSNSASLLPQVAQVAYDKKSSQVAGQQKKELPLGVEPVNFIPQNNIAEKEDAYADGWWQSTGPGCRGRSNWSLFFLPSPKPENMNCV